MRRAERSTKRALRRRLREKKDEPLRQEAAYVLVCREEDGRVVRGSKYGGVAENEEGAGVTAPLRGSIGAPESTRVVGRHVRELSTVEC